LREGRRIGIHHALGDAVMVAQINKKDAAMIAYAMTPARKADCLAGVRLTRIAAAVGTVAVHNRPKQKEGRFGKAP
jgi:hypothetical protein